MSNQEKQIGFSLVELLVGLAVAAIMFTAMFVLVSQCVRIIRTAREESRAAQAVAFEMEKLRFVSWPAIEGYGSQYTISTNDNIAMADLNNPSGTVKFHPAASSSSKTGTVSVSWQSQDGSQKTITSMSILAEKEPSR